MSEATVDATVDNSRRTWLITSCAMGGVGAAAVAVPFVSTFQPSERAKAAGAAVEVDISGLLPGTKMVAEWRGKPVWIMRRSEQQLADLEKIEPQLADPNSERKSVPTPAYALNRHRSIKPEVFVGVGICTHLGCSPSYVPELQPQAFDSEWQGGFYCPCHNSRFDLAGRVFQGVPAPSNLEVPPYHFVDDNHLVVGVAPEGAA